MESANAIADLQRRVRKVEDELDIMRLIASYSPLVDSGAPGRAPRLWLKDGVYDIDTMRMDSAADIEAMLGTEAHQDFIRAGSAHVMGLPRIELDGDKATAVNYTRVYVHDGENYRVARVSANIWQLERTAKGWRIRYRTNRLVRPGGPTPSMLGDAVRDPEAV